MLYISLEIRVVQFLRMEGLLLFVDLKIRWMKTVFPTGAGAFWQYLQQNIIPWLPAPGRAGHAVCLSSFAIASLKEIIMSSLDGQLL